jgi:DUF4097 and DUF4098 domain-containing protein YvlB
MRHLAITLIALASVAISAPSVRAADETEHITRTIRLDPGGTLRLKSFSGRVTITATDRNDVLIDAVRRAPRQRLDNIKLEIRSEGSNLVVIQANRRERSWYEFMGDNNNVVSTDFDIKVPRRTSVDVSVFSAPVTIEGVEGSHSVHSFSSRLLLDEVSGPIKAHSFSGSVAIHARNWQPNQKIDVDTFSGNVELRVPDTAQADVSFSSFSGQLNSDVPLTLRTSSRRNLRGRLGAGGAGAGDLRFKTFSGNVKIDR